MGYFAYLCAQIGISCQEIRIFAKHFLRRKWRIGIKWEAP